MIEMFNNITRKDLLYVLLILLSFITGQWASESTVVSHFSLSASVASILLALIAIFYMIERKGGIQEQVGRMNQVLTNLESASTSLHQKGEAIELRSQEFLNISKSRLTKEAESSTALPVPADDSKEYDISHSSVLGKLCLYWLCKQKNSNKVSSIEILAQELNDDNAKLYMYGFFVGADTKLGAMNIFGTFSIEHTLRAENIPEGLEKAVVAGLKQDIDDYKKDDSTKELDMVNYVEQKRKAIDAYFAD